MVEKKKKMKLDSIATERVYNSEAEIRADQEKIVNELFDNHKDFAYLKENKELSDKVRKGSIEGIRKGITEFMLQNKIKDIRDVFDKEFEKFYKIKHMEEFIICELIRHVDPTESMCKTEEFPFYKYEHIAEEVDSAYLDLMNDKYSKNCGRGLPSGLHSIKTSRVYNTKKEIKAEREKIVDELFEEYKDFAYLKEDEELLNRIKREIISSIKQSITEFMEEEGITDIRDVFDKHFEKFHNNNTIESFIINGLLNEDKVRESYSSEPEKFPANHCWKIAEQITQKYLNKIASRNLESGSDNTNMSDKPY